MCHVEKNPTALDRHVLDRGGGHCWVHSELRGRKFCQAMAEPTPHVSPAIRSLTVRGTDECQHRGSAARLSARRRGRTGWYAPMVTNASAQNSRRHSW